MTTTTTILPLAPPNATLPFDNAMPEITLEQALELVKYIYSDGAWRVLNVHGDVCGCVGGDVGGNVGGYVGGSVGGHVHGDVGGHVYGSVGNSVHGDVGGSVGRDVGRDVRGNVGGSVGGTISGRQWQFVETPLEKLKRLIESDAPKDQVLAALEEVAL